MMSMAIASVLLAVAFDGAATVGAGNSGHEPHFVACSERPQVAAGEHS